MSRHARRVRPRPAPSRMPLAGATALCAALCVALCAALTMTSTTASAHDLRPGVVAFEQDVGPGTDGSAAAGATRWRMRVVPPKDGAALPVVLRPVLPPGCAASGSGQVVTVRCEGALAGPLGLPSLAGRRVKVLVSVEGRGEDGPHTWHQLLREGQATVVLPGAASPAGHDRQAGWFGAGFFGLGVEHILGGIDHLLFVLALALLARGLRRVAIAVTGFTVAHSITLAAASLGLVHPPGAATELVIALSVLFLAAEAARSLRAPAGEPTLAARQPVLVALLFGLVHGFGFAGALGELGLPEDALLSSLLEFNLGVEAGQLGVLAAATALAWTVGRRLPNPTWAARAVASVIGVVAAAWCWERGFAWAEALTG